MASVERSFILADGTLRNVQKAHGVAHIAVAAWGLKNGKNELDTRGREQLAMEQLNLTGQTKLEMAIEFLQEHEPPEGYAGFFSGGKDSIVLMDVAQQAGVKATWFYSLMPDPPELLRFVKTFPVDILRPKYSFWKGILVNFPPHRHAAWCCQIIKESPSVAIPFTHRILGIRGEESSKRAKLGHINKITKNRINYHPLYDWAEWEIWEHIDGNGLKYCNLYDEGFNRLGCVVCPKRTNSKAQEMFLNRWPQYFNLFEKQVSKWWEIKGKFRTNETAKNVNEYLENWYRGK